MNLRAMEMSDLERNQRWMSDRDVTHFLSARYELSLAAEEAWMRTRAAQPVSWQNLLFAIETKEGRHIGNIDLHDVTAEDRKARLGVMIGEKDCWSKGYGSDAVRTLVGFAFREMNLNRIELQTFAYNERAIAAYRKCGFVEDGRLRQAHYARGAYYDIVIMSVLRADFDSAPE